MTAPERFRVGPRNLVTDVPGILVGNAHDERAKSGTTVLTARTPFVASVDVMGGAPGTRETDCLAPDRLVDAVDAIVLSGGSAFGLDAAGGVAQALREVGRGYAVGPVRVPIVPAAILFDLLGGGATDWVDAPWHALGREAFGTASAGFALGSVGAGTGATTANLKGGLGSASLVLPGGATVGALVAANPNGSAVDPDTGRFWAGPFEMDGEFGGRGVPAPADPLAIPTNRKYPAWRALPGNDGGDRDGGGNDDGGAAPGSPSRATLPPGGNTTLAIVATDFPLDKAGCLRLAVAAQDGMARALVPAHTPIDGDVVFALSTGTGPRGGPSSAGTLVDTARERLLLGHAAALCVARAIARAVYEACPAARDPLPTWRERYPEPDAGHRTGR